ncbi:uncharacterized protein [Haliotis cracherodii]|uniref:uncharacterized protein n=1 Tax=Haliotis cracherodii TaxID=6455 RepID=UPI0039EA4175
MSNTSLERNTGMDSLALLVSLLLMNYIGCDSKDTRPKTGDSEDEMLAAMSSQHWSIYNRPAFRSAFAKYIEIYNGTGGNMMDVDTRPTCKDARRNFTREAGNLCPAFYKLQVDETRWPKSMYQAECVCRKCMYGGRLNGKKRRSKRKFRCEKVYSHAIVIRRKCKENDCAYRLFLEAVAVACSCNMITP